MHLDGCVEVAGTYYGAPPGWLGRRVQVQWTDAIVRLLDPATGVAIDRHGLRLGDYTVPADSSGYRALITWAERQGRIEAFGIEGTGSYGAGLARAARRVGHRVVEVNRTDRRLRRAAGKCDTLDAEAAARSVLAGQVTATPKSVDGAVEMIRQLKIARDSAVKVRSVAMVTLKEIVVHAPPALREALQHLTDRELLKPCASLRPGSVDTPTASTKRTLRALTRRWFALADEMVVIFQEHDPTRGHGFSGP